MKNDQETLSFGRYLQTIRLEKKISLEQVAEQTRVGLGNLLLIEQEDHEQLPAEVFVKGFLRSYAAAVGADGDEAVRRYESRLGVVQKIAESETSGGKPDGRLWWKLIIALGMLLCIIALSVMAITFLRQAPGTGASAPSKPSASETKPAVEDTRAGTGLSPDSAQVIPQKLLLRITAQQNTWIKVIIDEKESAEYNLISGDVIELEAALGFNLLLGDAGGIKMTLNDKPVPIPGESGQVVTLHLP